MSAFAKSLVPLSTTIAMAIVCLLPWGVPPSLRLCPTLVPLAAIVIWNSSRAGHVPALGAFMLGLAIDVLTYGPLGYWAGSYVVAGILADLFQPEDDTSEPLFAWARSMAIVSAVLFAAWGVASAYFARVVDWRPFLLALVVMGVGLPIIAAVLAPAIAWVAGPQHPNLVRRGGA